VLVDGLTGPTTRISDRRRRRGVPRVGPGRSSAGPDSDITLVPDGDWVEGDSPQRRWSRHVSIL